ncbi:uncharacterized protein LOC122013606 [Zingiber officinale]|uniref:uncharacterized protein LOC122013606 n=1 Tax=Zingiber officinale TaxID=94328 RepID=UPI001C4DD180|nr:uncharacterized protein LOC122013606 [Zingiber officinale]
MSIIKITPIFHNSWATPPPAPGKQSINLLLRSSLPIKACGNSDFIVPHSLILEESDTNRARRREPLKFVLRMNPSRTGRGVLAGRRIRDVNSLHDFARKSLCHKAT